MAKKQPESPHVETQKTTERGMMYAVGLKPGHPTGLYRRAGGVFYRGSPTYVEFRLPALVNDPWLVVADEPVEIEWDKADEVSSDSLSVTGEG